MYVRESLLDDRIIPGVIQNIKTTEQDTLQIKISTSMTRDEIITSDVIYGTAHSILSQGMNEVSWKVLSFLSASLQAAARAGSPTQTRVAHARELLRRSGCLQDMLDMFLGALIMKEDNWKALCGCLVESCRDCEDNQNYCSSLIPACIKRSDVMSIEILKLLHCLLLNNTRNINLFVECNGTSIFTKDSVHDSSRMELLSVVVQNASAANLLKRDTDLLNSLIMVGEDYKVNCQGSWKMIEWASVILFHIATHIEGGDNSLGRTLEITDFANTMNNSKTTSSELSVSFLFKPNWEKVESKNIFKNAPTENVINDPILKNSMTALKPLSEDQMSSRSSLNGFVPKYVSTPKRRITTTNERQLASFSKELRNSTMTKNNNAWEDCRNTSAPSIKKKLSRSDRLFNIVNNSCVSIYNMMGTLFFRNSANTKPQGLLKHKLNINKGTKRETNRFTKYMKQRVSHTGPKASEKLNDQKQPKRQLAIRQKYRKGIVVKLKTGMHVYGCNFEKIAQVMWPHEKQMTPKVLYRIYRKFIVK